MINENFSANDVKKFINQDYNKKIDNNNSENINHNNHNEYTILEDVKDIPLHYCNECDSVIKTPISFSKKYSMICNDCIKSKCNCSFC